MPVPQGNLVFVLSQKIRIKCEALTMDRIKIYFCQKHQPVCYYYCVFLDLGFINVSKIPLKNKIQQSLI